MGVGCAVTNGGWRWPGGVTDIWIPVGRGRKLKQTADISFLFSGSEENQDFEFFFDVVEAVFQFSLHKND